MVVTFSKEQNGGDFVSPHFQVWEFQSYDDELDYLTTDTILIDDLNVKYLEDIYNHFNCSKIVITSGYRSEDFDIRIGGFAGYHSKGQAVDIMCYDANGEVINSSHICCYAETIGILGIGYGENYTHIDTRDWKSFFDETNGTNNITSWYDYFNIERPKDEKLKKWEEIKEVEKNILDLNLRLNNLLEEYEKL